MRVLMDESERRMVKRYLENLNEQGKEQLLYYLLIDDAEKIRKFVLDQVKEFDMLYSFHS